jgi:hypothetical protein
MQSVSWAGRGPVFDRQHRDAVSSPDYWLCHSTPSPPPSPTPRGYPGEGALGVPSPLAGEGQGEGVPARVNTHSRIVRASLAPARWTGDV